MKSVRLFLLHQPHFFIEPGLKATDVWHAELRYANNTKPRYTHYRCSRAPVHITHEDGPSTRPMNTGSVYRAPVDTARTDRPCSRVYTAQASFRPAVKRELCTDSQYIPSLSQTATKLVNGRQHNAKLLQLIQKRKNLFFRSSRKVSV